MGEFNRQLLVTYSKVFGEKISDDISNLSSLDKATWAKVIARLNHLARSRKNYHVKDVMGDWFGEDNHVAANEFWDKIVAQYSKLEVKSSELLIINIWSNLTLLDKVLASKSDGKPKLDNSESEKVLFQNYIAANDEFGEKSDAIFPQVKEEDYPNIADRFSRTILTLLFPYHELNHFTALELFVAQFIKSFYLLRFLEDNYKDLLNKFLEAYGAENWNEYLLGILPIAHQAALPGNDSGLNYLNLENTPTKQKSKKFLDQLSLEDEIEYSLATDFLHARSHPLYKVEEDNYLILDSVLTVNRIYNSMFFELLRIAEKDKSLNLKSGAFFSIYTFEFIEKYLCYSLLDRIFKKRGYLNLSGAEISNRFNLDTEPDYYVRNGNKIYLFEIKGSMLTGPVKQSFDFLAIEKQLKEKYLFDSTDGGNKAVKQLAERIKILFEQGDKSKYDTSYNARNIRIFPILLVSELTMTSPGVNHLLNEWFWEEVEHDDTLKAAKNRINDLVIIDIDTLIAFSREFEDSPKLLEEFLQAYIYACSYQRIESIRKKAGVSTQMLEARIMSTLESFGFFMRNKMNPRVPVIFHQFAKDLFPEKL